MLQDLEADMQEQEDDTEKMQNEYDARVGELEDLYEEAKSQVRGCSSRPIRRAS